MGVFNFRGQSSTDAGNGKSQPDIEQSAQPADKNDGNQISSDPTKDANDGVEGSEDAQAGVRGVEAATTIWTKYHLIGAYVM